MNLHKGQPTGLSFSANECNHATIVIQGGERFMSDEVDIAIAAWHEDGQWTLAQLPEPQDLVKIIGGLKAQQTNGGAIALVAIDEEFFMIIRVLGAHISMFLSDVTCALDYEVAGEFVELLDLPFPDDHDEATPVGQLDVLSDLGMSRMELAALCDDDELFPDEQLDAIANRLGFGEKFAELVGL
jgi:putative tRNA adenosine deaminase-associated protein